MLPSESKFSNPSRFTPGPFHRCEKPLCVSRLIVSISLNTGEFTHKTMHRRAGYDQKDITVCDRGETAQQKDFTEFTSPCTKVWPDIGVVETFYGFYQACNVACDDTSNDTLTRQIETMIAWS